MSAEWGYRPTDCKREGRSGCCEVVVGDPMFWKGSVMRLFFLSLFNLKQKHHLNIMVDIIGQNLDQTCELL